MRRARVAAARSGSLLVAVGLCATPLRAAEPAAEGGPAAPGSAPDRQAEPRTVEVRGRASPAAPVPGRAATRVTRQELEERLPRSAPDALRYEPGASVQQSAHGQASVYLRGRTGQQTLVLFDGVRLNTSTWRQGPNQYFFTVDAYTIHSLEVIRGGASTRYGSDAVAGVIDARPLEPRLVLGLPGTHAWPRSVVRWSSQDAGFGNRFQVDAQLTPGWRVLAGLGVRDVGLLESGGPVRSPRTGEVPQVPAFEADGRTQRGTGWHDLTGDLRLVRQLGEHHRLVLGGYAYRQFDSPRTDQCPPPFAPTSECLRYDEQFRSLVLATAEGPVLGWERSRVTLSYQRNHERRTNDRPASFVQNGGRDDVDTLGVMAQASWPALALTATHALTPSVGADVYADQVDSAAWTTFTDIDAVIPASRGQYLAGSSYQHGGAFGELRWDTPFGLTAWGGGRLGAARARAPGDAPSGTRPVDDAWFTTAAHLRAEQALTGWLTLVAGVDRAFRTPNLDDLTSRQQSGPGFQFENAALAPEVTHTGELGLRAAAPGVEVDAWVFRSVTEGAITRAFRDSTDCPPATPQCQLSWSRYQLVNAAGPSTIDGVELWTRLFPRPDLSLRATLAWTYGVGPNPTPRPTTPGGAFPAEVPLSRIPPLNGTLEARFEPTPRSYLGAGLRWASLQDRLAPTDTRDARIPEGGTPGYAVVDLRAGWRLERRLVLNLAVENVLDAAYRVHGSSINGPGRGVVVGMEAGL